MADKVLSEQVQKALVAHGAWKVRLARAIDAGSSEFTSETVRLDDRCELGKWLYGGISLELRSQPQYQTVRTLHAQFHLAAAAVLDLALAGSKTDAREAIANGEFSRISTKLTIALSNWRDAN